LHPSEPGTDIGSYLLPEVADAKRAAPQNAYEQADHEDHHDHGYRLLSTTPELGALKLKTRQHLLAGSSLVSLNVATHVDIPKLYKDASGVQKDTERTGWGVCARPTRNIPLPLTALSQTGEPVPDLSVLTGRETDPDTTPDLLEWTPAHSPDVRHETTDRTANDLLSGWLLINQTLKARWIACT
jgi:hypothetical protein